MFWPSILSHQLQIRELDVDLELRFLKIPSSRGWHTQWNLISPFVTTSTICGEKMDMFQCSLVHCQIIFFQVLLFTVKVGVEALHLIFSCRLKKRNNCTLSSKIYGNRGKGFNSTSDTWPNTHSFLDTKVVETYIITLIASIKIPFWALYLV